MNEQGDARSQVSDEVLDPAQLARIEATHRGFLYQHVYTAGCLLLASSAGVATVAVERDEDLELEYLDGRRCYVQVKTRMRSLQPHDVLPAIEHFARIRADRGAPIAAQGGNSAPLSGDAEWGHARFVIASSAQPSAALHRLMTSGTIPADVMITWPGASNKTPPGLPPAWASITEACQWCAERATEVPYTRLVPMSLVWKLAALAQAAGSGGLDGIVESHRFAVAALPEFFEQVIESLFDLPPAPTPYWPLEHEPTISGVTTPVLLISAPPGSGKTAWASTHAAHTGSPTAYIPAMRGTPFLSSLARELAARVGRVGEGERAAILATASGAEALRRLDRALESRGATVIVIIDDAHLVAPEDIRDAIQCLRVARWVLLAHPGPMVAAIESRLDLRAVVLGGWARETIAAVLKAHECRVDLAVAERVRAFTGGVPLFVRNLARLAAELSGGDVDALCTTLEQGRHARATAQESVLVAVLDQLDPSAHILAELLSVAGVTLQPDEIERLATAAGVPVAAANRALRTLETWQVLRLEARGGVRLHEAYRVLFDGSGGTLDEARRTAAKRLLLSLLDPWGKIVARDRVPQYLAIMSEVGTSADWRNVAIHFGRHLPDLGYRDHALEVLETVVADEAARPLDRFWAANTLAFLSGSVVDPRPAEQWYRMMEALSQQSDLGDESRRALYEGRMALAAASGDVRGLQTAFGQLRDLVTDDPDALLRARATLAWALFTAKRFGDSADSAWTLAHDASDRISEIIVAAEAAVPPAERGPIFVLGGEAEVAVRQLAGNVASTFDLHIRAREAIGRQPNEGARYSAFTMYRQSGADQAATAGLFVLQELGQAFRFPEARHFAEAELLPLLEAPQFAHALVPARALYAQILALSGDVPRARVELERARSVYSQKDPGVESIIGMAEYVIEQQASQRTPPRRAMPNGRTGPRAPRAGSAPPGQGSLAGPRPGRNAPCPCGSGRKFKHCCLG